MGYLKIFLICFNLVHHRTSGIWYTRIVVPEAQQGILGKREIRKSLASRESLQAVRLTYDCNAQELSRFTPRLFSLSLLFRQF
ncbi:DUF6538 domain-containing protein [Shewanella insulae]|uniref:DUF6538 domain-containing protein n=1 Tax=Shewanella insulae TaxID=2681496 RepID=UPI003CE56EEC